MNQQLVLFSLDRQSVSMTLSEPEMISCGLVTILLFVLYLVFI